LEVRLSALKWPLSGLIWRKNGLVGRLLSLSMLSETPDRRMMDGPDAVYIVRLRYEIRCKGSGAS
jgi:hypothetical protein